MNPQLRRALLYSVATPVLAALIYGGFVYRASPDLGTLLGSANVQLRLAMGMPAKDRGGEPLAAREQLLASAARYLEQAHQLDPESPIVAEFEGFLAGQRGNPRDAAAHYRRARGLPGCTVDQRDTLVFNEARMLSSAGDDKAGLAVLTASAGSMRGEYRSQCAIERAGMMHRLGRDEDACGEIAMILQGNEPPLTWLQAGRLYAQMGRVAEAEAALVRASTEVPIADYDLARLKLASGDVDTSLRLLERATKAARAEVGRLLREDAAAWQAVAEDARFRALNEPDTATPGR